MTREQLARAAVEGVVCGMLDALDALMAHAPVTSVVLTGGGARSAAVRQVFADLCSVPVSLSTADEAVATGACVQAAAVALEVDHQEVIRRWGLGGSTEVPASAAGGREAAAAVRGAYAAVRDRQYPSA